MEPDHRWRRIIELFNADVRLRRSYSDGRVRTGLAWLRSLRDGRVPAADRPDPFADIRAAHELRFGDDDRRSVVDAGLTAIPGS